MPIATNAQGRSAMGQARPKNRAVLIVEDDAEVRSLAATLLEDEQLDIIECESAESALAIMLIQRRLSDPLGRGV
jgi:CheY-like chemotaxis protein